MTNRRNFIPLKFFLEALIHLRLSHIEHLKNSRARVCEFFPHAEDGYPESAFIPIDVYEFIPKNIASAKKVYYVVSEIGSGKYFTEPEQINNLISSLSDMKVYPIERFLTSNEILLNRRKMKNRSAKYIWI